MKHRMKDDHLCSTLIPIGARPKDSGVTQAQRAFARLKAWGKSKSEAVSATSVMPERKRANVRTNQILALNKLKKDAKGDSKIPAEKRVYLHVEAEAATTTSKVYAGDYFYSKEWSVGRLLDEAARVLQVENVNNRGGGEDSKLRVFHIEGGRLLEFSEKIGTALQNGNTIVLLRGIGPAVPDLIEV